MSKRLFLFFLLSVSLLFLSDLRPVIGATAELQNATGRVIWSEKGLSLQPAFGAPEILGDSSKADWSVLITSAPVQIGKAPKNVRFESSDQKGLLEKTENGFEITYPTLIFDKKIWQISLKLTFTQTKKSFLVSAEIINSEKNWLVSELTGPVLKKLSFDVSSHSIYWPSGLGRKISMTPDDKTGVVDDFGRGWQKNHWGYELTARYPGSECTMQYTVFGGEKTSLYFGAPDRSRTVKDFGLRYNPENKFWTAFVRYYPMVQPNASWKTDLFELMPYQDDWHAGADYYRQWFEQNFQQCAAPDWVRSLSGMMLYIMKQQKGRHLMWTYNEIGGTMTDLADEFGFDFIALFGWAHGGHDHLYPEYFPDEKMGGAGVLKKEIAKARARGKHVYLYANGQLMDQANVSFWNRLGKSIALVRGDGSPVTEKWHKFSDQEAFIHGVACSFDERWFPIMFDLAKQANDLGANGILFDQLAVGSPIQCFSSDHGHAVPVFSRGYANAALLERLDRAIKKINPDFVVLTEGWHDMANTGVPYFHASGIIRGSVPPESLLTALAQKAPGCIAFPGMFRYTFPKTEVTIRNPFPVEHPRYCNYACFYALNHEIEIRYPTDVQTIKTKTTPTLDGYKKDAVNGLGGLRAAIADLGQTSAQECMIHTKKVIDFQRANSEFLLTGQFTDNKGFKLTGNILAAGFESSKGLAVLVWNPGSKEENFSLTVPDAKAIRACSPSEAAIKDNFFKSLAPNSLRLIVFEK